MNISLTPSCQLLLVAICDDILYKQTIICMMVCIYIYIYVMICYLHIPLYVRVYYICKQLPGNVVLSMFLSSPYNEQHYHVSLTSQEHNKSVKIT